MPKPIDWHHPRTALAEQYLRMFVVVGAPSLVLFAPRGYGKTQFVTRDLIPAATAAGMAPVYVNFWEDNTRPAASVVAALLKALHAEPGIAHSLKQEARRLAGEFGLSLDAGIPGLGKASASAKLSRPAKPDDAPSDPLLLMHRLTERLAKALGKTLLLVFDEVQTLAAKPEHETFVRSLRTMLDSQRHSVCSVFTGSSQSKLAEMFQRIRAPLYNFSRNDVLPALGDDFLALWLSNIRSLIGTDNTLTLERMRAAFASTERNPRIFFSAVTDMVMRGSSEIERFTRAAVADAQSNSGVIQRLRSLTPLDRVVLTAIIRHEQRIQRGEIERGAPFGLFSQPSRQQMAQVLGITPTPQQVQSSLRRLSSDEIQLVISLERGQYQIEDPLFMEALADILLRQTDDAGAAAVVTPGLLELAADEATLRAEAAQPASAPPGTMKPN
ncbi:MAG: hypothetical protein ACOVOG_07495 [Rubrivivax sp.]|jgi:hypothetical protein